MRPGAADESEGNMSMFEGEGSRAVLVGVAAEQPALVLNPTISQSLLRIDAGTVRLPPDLAIRLIDITLSLVLLIFLLPVMLAISAAIRLEGGGDIFFGHKRIGKDGVAFRCLKFRTMVPDAEERLHALLARDAVARCEWTRDQKLRNDPRITCIGRFLRRSSLDELPQILNVLRGEMSLVGPRPIVSSEIVRYGRYYSDYTSVRPGISGLWQISGRNDVCYRRRVAFDVIYARKRSIGLYLAVVIRTPARVLLSTGSY